MWGCVGICGVRKGDAHVVLNIRAYVCMRWALRARIYGGRDTLAFEVGAMCSHMQRALRDRIHALA